MTLNMGFVMPAWYDITSLDERGQDEPGIQRSAASIRRLIEREKERGDDENENTRDRDRGEGHSL